MRLINVYTKGKGPMPDSDDIKILLDYVADTREYDCSDEALMGYARDYEEQHPVDEGDHIHVAFLYRGSNYNPKTERWEPTYFYGRGVICEKQDGKLKQIGSCMG